MSTSKQMSESERAAWRAGAEWMRREATGIARARCLSLQWESEFCADCQDPPCNACQDADKIAALPLPEPPGEVTEKDDETKRLVRALVWSLNDAHNEILKLQGCTDLYRYDWPEWSSPANSIRWAEKMLGEKLAKTNIWSMFPETSGAKEGE